MVFIVAEPEGKIVKGDISCVSLAYGYRIVTVTDKSSFVRQDALIFGTEQAAAAWLVERKRSEQAKADFFTDDGKARTKGVWDAGYACGVHDTKNAALVAQVKHREDAKRERDELKERLLGMTRSRDEWANKADKSAAETEAIMKDRDRWKQIAENGWPGGSNEEHLKNMLAASEKRNEKLVADLEAARVKYKSLYEVNEQLMREKSKLRYNITSMDEQLASVKKNRDEWTRRHEMANKENRHLASVVREKDARIAELENAAKPPAFKAGDRVQWSGYDGVPEKGHIVSIHDDLASVIIAMDDPEKRCNYVSIHRLQREQP